MSLLEDGQQGFCDRLGRCKHLLLHQRLREPFRDDQ